MASRESNKVLIGIACEDEQHCRVATRLVDVACTASHGGSSELVESCRTWRGLREDQPWYKYDPKDARDLRPVRVDGMTIKRHGHIDGKPLLPEASMWRNVLMLFHQLDPRPDVVLLVRDLDGYQKRKQGLDQVRHGFRWDFAVVAATPQPEIEAWYVAGFDPQDGAEERRLGGLRKKLSFDPTKESHRLTARPNNAVTDAKVVLEELCAGDPERELACLDDLSCLRERGRENGLCAFLGEVDEVIVRRIVGLARSRAKGP